MWRKGLNLRLCFKLSTYKRQLCQMMQKLSVIFERVMFFVNHKKQEAGHETLENHSILLDSIEHIYNRKENVNYLVIQYIHVHLRLVFLYQHMFVCQYKVWLNFIIPFLQTFIGASISNDYGIHIVRT